MDIKVRPYETGDAKDTVMIWNQVVEEGVAFPQTELLTETTGDIFFKEQSFTGIAYDCESLMIVNSEELSGSISSIRIMSDGAVISAMPVMRCEQM